FFPADSEAIELGMSTQWLRINFWFSKIVPFLYGALGACSYLIRSGNRFIYERTFDERRLPEYLNRILLGFLAGGTVHLFISEESVKGALASLNQGVGMVTLQLTTKDLSAKALAFLAGYSTDFLYTTIERIVAAV